MSPPEARNAAAMALDVSETYQDLAQLWLELDPARSEVCARNAAYWNDVARRHLETVH